MDDDWLMIDTNGSVMGLESPSILDSQGREWIQNNDITEPPSATSLHLMPTESPSPSNEGMTHTVHPSIAGSVDPLALLKARVGGKKGRKKVRRAGRWIKGKGYDFLGLCAEGEESNTRCTL